MEVSGPILHAQLLETYLLNILGFSIIEATLAARTMIAARGIPVVDFGLRRCQGPISSLRAARGAQIAGFAGTSNVYAARLLGLPPSGTMAHSFIEAHSSEEQAFRDYAEIYGARAILLVDTYDSIEGIKTAARVAKDFLGKGTRIRGIRLDSGDLVELSKFARAYFKNEGLEFLTHLRQRRPGRVPDRGITGGRRRDRRHRHRHALHGLPARPRHRDRVQIGAVW